MTRLLAGMLVNTVAICLPAMAGPIENVSQERFVHVSANVAGELFSEQVDAPDFSDFDVVLGKIFSNAEGSASGLASQASSLSAASILATGSTEGTTGPPAGSSGGGGKSFFSVDFRVDQPVDFTLDFKMSSEFGGYSFVGPSLNQVALYDLTGFSLLEVNESGVLSPGDYAFEIQMDSGGASEGLRSSFDLDFQVTPEPMSLALLIAGLAGLHPWRRVAGAKRSVPQ